MALNVLVICAFSFIYYIKEGMISPSLYIMQTFGQGISCAFLVFAMCKIRNFLIKTGFRGQINYKMFMIHALCFSCLILQTVFYDIIYAVFLLKTEFTIRKLHILGVLAIINIVLDFTVQVLMIVIFF